MDVFKDFKAMNRSSRHVARIARPLEIKPKVEINRPNPVIILENFILCLTK